MNGTRDVSQSNNGAKRERSDDEEEQETRRVSQRTNGDTMTATDDANKSIKQYVNALARSNDEGVITEKMRELLEILFNESNPLESHQEAFDRVGGPLAVVVAMEKYPDCKVLQRNGMSVLVSAKHKNDELTSVVGEVGGIQAVVAAMKRFPTWKGIIQLSLGALGNLATHSANAKVLVLGTDAVTCIISAMNKFQDSADIVSQGCEVLLNLSSVEDLKMPLREANVRTALAAAMDGHKGDDEIQNRAGQAMTNLLE